MPLTPIDAPTRVQHVISRLADFVTEQGVEPGGRLPSNRELAERLGVSRPILREALSHLAALHILEPRTGSGTYLLRPFGNTTFHVVMQLEGERDTLLHVHELRRAIETEVAALAAERATDEDVERLGRLLDVLEQDFEHHGRNPESDRAFHDALYATARNPLFEQVTRALREQLDRFWNDPLGKHHFASRSVPLHRQVFERVRNRDPEGARSAMHALLRTVEDDLRA